jgi:hypothetical protein
VLLNQDAAETDGLAPLRFPSPRLVGLNGRQPHPLWWLGVSEAIGDTVARRALGPVRGETEAAMTVWAALAGDVTIWAERLSQTNLPQTATQPPSDPADIGLSLLSAPSDQRQAARNFALFLHTRFGEAKTLAWLLKLHEQTLSAASPAIDDFTIDQLRQAWRTRL